MEELNDLSQLDNLNTQTIGKALKGRYGKDIIYTNCGDILIAVNPYKLLPIFDKDDHEKYDGKNFTRAPPPHVFYTAARAYRRMRETSTNQVILVSGESGAGKTESTKLMVKHFIHMCPQESGDLHERIVQVNPLLEAFGNAKTIMNDNSSRFAKYLELSFREDGQVLGAICRDYLLEKSRVVKRGDDEGNFHIFYSLFAGAEESLLKELQLERPETYRIMRGNKQLLRDQKATYRQQYTEHMEVLQKIGLEKPDIDILHSMLASILHITQLEFDDPQSANEPLVVKNPETLKKVTDLLSLDLESLAGAIICRRTTFATENITTNKTVPQAEDGRDALAKALYERMFGWIVRKINENLHPSKSRCRKAAAIGILDIAGFEKLQTNSFEQMCINIVNERLQNFTNKNVFDYEMSIYKDEEIELPDIQFENNENLLTLFNAKKFGILALLDEETKLQQGTDLSFVKKLEDRYGDHACYTKTPQSGVAPEFGIKHFAGQVWYNGRDFLEKNRDMLHADLLKCMKDSTNEFLSDLFTVKKGPTGTISATMHEIRKSRKCLGGGGGAVKAKTDAGKQLQMELGKSLLKRYGQLQPAINSVHNPKDHKTVISYFQHSMQDLLEKMRIAVPYFVRCIKPNTYQQPDHFDEMKVEDQLVYNGISEIAVIRRMGLPIRKSYDDFATRYCVLCKASTMESSPKSKSNTVLGKMLPRFMAKDYRFGKTKVFMTDDVNIWLERCLTKKQKSAVDVIEKHYICYKKEQERKRLEQQERIRALAQGLEEETPGASRLGSSFKRGSFEKFYSGDEEDEKSSSSEEKESDDKPPEYSKPKVDFRLRDSKKIYKKYSGSVDEQDSSSSQRSSTIPSPPPTNSIPKQEAEEKESQETKFWDIFQIISRDSVSEDVHKHTYLQILKVIVYLILALLLLVCNVCQKISLMTLVADQGNSGSSQKDKATDSARYILVLTAMCIPYALIFLSNLWKWLFGNIPLPSLRSVIVICVMECAHTVGLSLLVFRVLPELDSLRGLFVLSSTCILPSMLRPMFTTTGKSDKYRCSSFCGKLLELMADTLALVCQLSTIPVLVLLGFFVGFDGTSNQSKIVEVAIALFLSSFSWWENYVDDRICGKVDQKNPWHLALQGIKFDLQESRPAFSTMTSVLKIGLTISLAYAFKGELSFNLTEAVSKLRGDASDITLNTSIIILTFTAPVAYYAAYIACKLQMQIVSFSIPLFFSTPCAGLLITFDCKYKFLNAVSQENRTCDDITESEFWWHLLITIAWWISSYWISRHIWFPSQKRLAKVENLFLNPLYCGVLLEQHLIMNRRRHTRRVIRHMHEGRYIYSVTSEIIGHADTSENGSEGEELQSGKNYGIPPMIYACVTMWHETRDEMFQLLKSLFRLERDQFIRRVSVHFGADPEHIDYYEFEPHIFFDDAYETDDNGQRIPNTFVKMLFDLIDESASCVYEKSTTLDPPFIIPSPYGDQYVFSMPSGNLMYIHLKDTNKIRNKKRWSQVMYMYYLLGYRIVQECKERVMKAMENGDFNDLISWKEYEKMATGNVGKSQIFQFLDDEVIYRAENTYVLSLDGDVYFTSGAVRILLDKMLKNPRVGAVCGRTHPAGQGPMVWYQKFEYAIIHWLQKSSEHVLGCVTCSTGCFSLYRGSALMDDNVMKKYTSPPTEPSHHLKYDQGEDRWLCTLLLQQGYRVDYAAASDAHTFAPEGFNEFFDQRRRWMPSTIANILDLINDAKNTVSINSNVSWLYIFYQGAVLVLTLMGPSTLLLMIAGGIQAVFGLNLIDSYLISCLPAALYFFACFWMKTKLQLIGAQILSAIYIFIMMVVFVGVIITAVKESPLHPSVLFLLALGIIFTTAAAFHPNEFSCLMFSPLYFLCLPMGYLFIVIYAFVNLNVISWGTREKAEEKAGKEASEEKEEKKQGFFGRMVPQTQIKELFKVMLDLQENNNKSSANNEYMDLLNEINKKLSNSIQKPQEKQMGVKVSFEEYDTVIPVNVKIDQEDVKSVDDDEGEITKTAMDKPSSFFFENRKIRQGTIMKMNDEEEQFWKDFIERYEKPFDLSTEEEKSTKEGLKTLRTNTCAGFAVANLMWLAINFMFQLKKPAEINLPMPAGYDEESEEINQQNIKVDVLGLLFIMYFVAVLLIQFICMIIHRWGTFLHLVAITQIHNPFERQNTETNDMEEGSGNQKHTSSQTMKFCAKLCSEPILEYSSDEEELDRRKEEVKEIIENNAKFGVKDNIGVSRRETSFGRSLRNTEARSCFGVSQRTTFGSDLRNSRLPNTDFRSTVSAFLERTNNRKEALDSKENIGAIRRPTKVGNTFIGATLVDDPLNAPPKRFGATSNIHKDFLKRLPDKHIRDSNIRNELIPVRRTRNASDLGATFQGGMMNLDSLQEDDDDIYGAIPGGTLGKAFGRKLRKVRKDQRHHGSSNPGRNNSDLLNRTTEDTAL